jgi:hypothetical protein
MTWRNDVDFLEPAHVGHGSLLELLNRLLDRGVLVWGDLRISVAGVELIEIGLKVMLVSFETADRWRAHSLAARPAVVDGAAGAT